jgi:hypothetical protein
MLKTKLFSNNFTVNYIVYMYTLLWVEVDISIFVLQHRLLLSSATNYIYFTANHMDVKKNDLHFTVK